LSTAASRKCRGSQLEKSAIAGATRAVLESGARAKMVVRLHEELLVLCMGYEVGAAKLNVETSPMDSASAWDFEPIYVDFEMLDFRIERSCRQS
jgi:hypothetical protein